MSKAVAKPKRGRQGEGGGRPTKLTEDLITEIANYVKAGNDIHICCQAVGICKTQFYNWMKRGNDISNGLHRKFRDSILRAQAFAEIRDVVVVDRAATDGDWRAAAWKLERRAPDRWGRREALAIEHGGQIKQVVVEERRQALHAVIQRPELLAALAEAEELLRPARDDAEPATIEAEYKEEP